MADEDKNKKNKTTLEEHKAGLSRLDTDQENERSSYYANRTDGVTYDGEWEKNLRDTYDKKKYDYNQSYFNGRNEVTHIKPEETYTFNKYGEPVTGYWTGYNSDNNLLFRLNNGTLIGLDPYEEKLYNTKDRLKYSDEDRQKDNENAKAHPDLMYKGDLKYLSDLYDQNGEDWNAQTEEVKNNMLRSFEEYKNKRDNSNIRIGKEKKKKTAVQQPQQEQPSTFNEDDIVNMVNNSKANWVQRLQNGNKKTIPDWNDPDNTVASHRLGYATGEGGKVYVYPSVQEINGELYDYTDPKNNRGEWDSLDNAIKTGDYVEFPNEESAKWYTENYKKYYDGTKKYSQPTQSVSVDAQQESPKQTVNTQPQQEQVPTIIGNGSGNVQKHATNSAPSAMPTAPAPAPAPSANTQPVISTTQSEVDNNSGNAQKQATNSTPSAMPNKPMVGTETSAKVAPNIPNAKSEPLPAYNKQTQNTQTKMSTKDTILNTKPAEAPKTATAQVEGNVDSSAVTVTPTGSQGTVETAPANTTSGTTQQTSTATTQQNTAPANTTIGTVTQQPAPAPPTPAQQMTDAVNGGQPALSYINQFLENSPVKPMTPEEKAKLEKKKKRDQIFSAIGDGISSLANLYFTSKGAPSMFDASKSASKATKDRYEKMEKDYQENMKWYNNARMQAQQADDAKNNADREFQNKKDRQAEDDRRRAEDVQDRKDQQKYQQERDKVADEHWNKQYEESKRQFDINSKQGQQQINLGYKKLEKEAGKDYHEFITGGTAVKIPKERLNPTNIAGMFSKCPPEIQARFTRKQATVNGIPIEGQYTDVTPSTEDMLVAIGMCADTPEVQYAIKKLSTGY